MFFGSRPTPISRPEESHCPAWCTVPKERHGCWDWGDDGWYCRHEAELAVLLDTKGRVLLRVVVAALERSDRLEPAGIYFDEEGRITAEAGPSIEPSQLRSLGAVLNTAADRFEATAETYG